MWGFSGLAWLQCRAGGFDTGLRCHIAHIAHIARTCKTVGVRRLGVASMPGRRLRYRASIPYSTYSTYSKWGFGGFSAGWRTRVFGSILTLVRPGNDLVLRRIRNLKRCVQACGCNITTPRYAPQFGSRLHFKRCQALPKEPPFPFFWDPFFGDPFFFFCFFLALQRLARLKCNLESNCKHI